MPNIIMADKKPGDYEASDWLDLTKPVGVVTSSVQFNNNSSGYNFFGRTGITELHLPETLYVPRYICYRCLNLEDITAPNATTISENAFEQCKLSVVVFPKVVQVKSYAFKSILSLKSADFGGTPGLNAGFDGSQTFCGSSNFDTLVLRGLAVWRLSLTLTFDGTKFAYGKSGGTLYVPASLISSYQAATNWATILGYENNHIKSIESTATDPDAPVDLTTHYIDGTPIPNA